MMVAHHPAPPRGVEQRVGHPCVVDVEQGDDAEFAIWLRCRLCDQGVDRTEIAVGEASRAPGEALARLVDRRPKLPARGVVEQIAAAAQLAACLACEPRRVSPAAW